MTIVCAPRDDTSKTTDGTRMASSGTSGVNICWGEKVGCKKINQTSDRLEVFLGRIYKYNWMNDLGVLVQLFCWLTAKA